MENIEKIVLDKHKLISEDSRLSSFDGKFEKYKIEINKLLLNPYNDRIAKERSEDKDFDENNLKKKWFSDNVQQKISDLIWNINTKRNEQTLKNIKEIGIEKPIVIDQIGLVIDGNRRVSISRKILKDSSLNLEQSNKLKEINCIVIPKTLNKNEISEYETKLQMAEDSKLEYDPINIYLKVNKLLKEKKEEILNQEARYKAVSQLMGSTKYNKNIIKTFGETFDVMEDYLISIGKEKKYKELEHKEDQFKNFSKFWINLEQKKYESPNFDFQDIENRKNIRKICYALINQQVEGKIFREIFPKTKNPSGPFTSKKSIEYLKNQLKINDSNDENLKKWVENSNYKKFPSEKLKKFIKTSKDISLGVNDEINKNTKVFIEDILEKIKKLKIKFQEKKDKNNKPFLNNIKEIKNKINEIINDIEKDRY